MNNSVDPTRVSDVETMDQLENELLNNHSNIGLNIDSTYIIDPLKYRTALEINGDETAYAALADRMGVYPGVIRYGAETELAKPDALVNKLSAVPEGCSFRVNCYPPSDPFSMDYCDEIGTHFDKMAVKQLEQIKEHTGESELRIVVNPYTHDKGVHVPDSNAEKEAYLQACRGVLRTVSDDGTGVMIELGNEMNVSQETKNKDGVSMFAGNRVFADKQISADAYADWYYETTSALKEEFPNAKFAIAGTAFYDYKFCHDVASRIIDKPGGADLIDDIGMHPYRSTSKEGTSVVEDGNIADKTMSYAEQSKAIRKLADGITMCRSEGKCEASIGEISYYQPDQHGISIDYTQMDNESDLAEATGMKTYVWPAVSMTSASQMEQVRTAAKREYEAQSIVSSCEQMNPNIDLE